MQKPNDFTPSSNSLNSVKGKTDRASDHTNDLRGDRKFSSDFDPKDSKNISNAEEYPESISAQPKESKFGYGSRAETLEEDDKNLDDTKTH